MQIGNMNLNVQPGQQLANDQHVQQDAVEVPIEIDGTLVAISQSAALAWTAPKEDSSEWKSTPKTTEINSVETPIMSLAIDWYKADGNRKTIKVEVPNPSVAPGPVRFTNLRIAVNRSRKASFVADAVANLDEEA